MSLAELLPESQSLPHSDKLRLLNFQATGLARAEELPEIQPGAADPVWSPYNAFEAQVSWSRHSNGYSHPGPTESIC